MQTELSTQYDPKDIEEKISERWLAAKAFAASPDAREKRYVIMMPLPNVTGALHMGHAMDNVMQDLLIRWHRMQGENTLWMAGTDHAGIATQAVVEKRLFELEGKTRHDIGREELVRRIWQWKDEYQERIVKQQQAMGCSCDWDRQRFTMDEVCARAVRHTFYSMFKDGLIYRGDRLVNWDCHLQTAISDDELYKKTVRGHFWHLRYPVIDPRQGEPQHVVVATTRPETMLGDTAVATHPDPEGALQALLEEAREKLADAQGRGNAKDSEAAKAEIQRLQSRKESHLQGLLALAEMARDGRQVMLPLQERPIPLILDEWAKPDLGSGCVKITPAHDPNDYEVWQRHKSEIELINILEEDGSLNQNAGAYAGLDRFEARAQVVKDLESKGLLQEIEDREMEVDHSDRSKTMIEPYLSKQWFVKMGDVEGGVILGRGTPKEFVSPGLAQAAIDAVDPNWRSKTGRNLTFHPDPVRYGNFYRNWLAEKRDWCISRQLWWGHRIPVWTGHWTAQQLLDLEFVLAQHKNREDVHAWFVLPDGRQLDAGEALAHCRQAERDQKLEVQLCFRDKATEEGLASTLRGVGLSPDPDVLDTWFSSALWPHSTLGWPDPKTAALDEGQSALAAAGEAEAEAEDCLSYYYPGSCLVTARDIITLWVARMVIMGLYNLGDLPFTDSFIHANIQDGKGNKMSKSAGNGIDPVDIIDRYGADAMRYVICELQTGTQDVRLPVQAISPFTGETVDLATAKHGSTIFTYICPKSGKEFDVLGTMPDMPSAHLLSDRFDVGRAFCNKLWNAARFALMNLQEVGFGRLEVQGLEIEDRWILSRLSRAIESVNQQLELYNPSAAISGVREFFWAELCDWYLEMIKPRLRQGDSAATARQVLATALDQVLRLLHPFVPFITEELWEKLGSQAPRRGVDEELDPSPLLVRAAWPTPRQDWQNEELEAQISAMQELVTSIREIRARYGVPPGKQVQVRIRTEGRKARDLEVGLAHIMNLAKASSVDIFPVGESLKAADAATAIVGEVEIFVLGVVDVEKERAKLRKQEEKLRIQAASTEKKLGNQGFLAKAPPAIVEREKQNLRQMQSQLKSLAQSLKDLDES